MHKLKTLNKQQHKNLLSITNNIINEFNSINEYSEFEEFNLSDFYVIDNELYLIFFEGMAQHTAILKNDDLNILNSVDNEKLKRLENKIKIEITY